jgi:hypothetical protein
MQSCRSWQRIDAVTARRYRHALLRKAMTGFGPSSQRPQWTTRWPSGPPLDRPSLRQQAAATTPNRSRPLSRDTTTPASRHETIRDGSLLSPERRALRMAGAPMTTPVHPSQRTLIDHAPAEDVRNDVPHLARLDHSRELIPPRYDPPRRCHPRDRNPADPGLSLGQPADSTGLRGIVRACGIVDAPRA